jgi:carboxymethylenebutenolidase
MEITSSEIQLNVNGRQVKAYFSAPKAGSKKSVLLLHAWWGLNSFFKQLSEKLAAQGYSVLAPDLRNGEIANTVDEAKALMEKEDNQFVGDVVMAAKDHLFGIAKSKMAVMGFSMGAAWALVASGFDPDKISAVVLFYGVYETDYTKVKAKFLGHFAEVDEWEPLDGVRKMESDMKNAGLDVTIHIYPNVAHWFMEDNKPEFNAETANLAWGRTLEFLNSAL